MRTQSKLIGLTFILFLFNLTSFSQPIGHWQLGGNSNTPFPDDITVPGKNILGSQAGFNIPIRFGTNGFDRMRIEAGNNTIAGGKVSFFETTPIALFTPRARVNIYQSTGLADFRLTTGTRLALNEGMLMYYDNANNRGYLGNLTAA